MGQTRQELLKPGAMRAEKTCMSDLSRILDGVYSPPVREVEVASETVLDQAFAGWVPGPTDEAADTDRGLFAMVLDEPTVEPGPTLEWLTTEVSTTEREEWPAAGFSGLADLAELAATASVVDRVVLPVDEPEVEVSRSIPPVPVPEPEPVFEAPVPVPEPEPVFVAPVPVFEAPEPVFEAPEPVHVAPAPIFVAPSRVRPKRSAPAHAWRHDDDNLVPKRKPAP